MMWIFVRIWFNIFLFTVARQVFTYRQDVAPDVGDQCSYLHKKAMFN